MDDNKTNKRNSMLAYIPIHRRNEEDDNRRATTNKYRSSMNQDVILQPEATVSSGSTKRASFIHRRPMSSNNRYNRHSFFGDDGNDYDKNTTFEDGNEQVEDWESILKQYDRYSMTEDDKRKSKRASRLFESFQDSPVEVPPAEEPTVILDCYDFPPAFKTHHLHDIFRSYESSRGGYKIKWLSDTRALIIFDHPATAKKAYIDNVTHALAKIRPYDGPTDFLKENNINQQQKPTNNNRPMSMDIKRQSFNNNRTSNRNSMRIDDAAVITNKRLSSVFN
ncbi:uncharacterized protein BX663DRAFT_510713 [Cokeromyces recurvatus]|uniref:uncharacterized protein n=1 Tax=Cokeromyces recurvatus TaxID=90255 RepID=UPI00221E4789|nr:uncharacterized protein BX663DRAFT_510713 [Cokeromyces recurvatus]KAI7902314.1 hypothetical protein BX663DRAFT_510713 [Cokeromyces recurvatus]